MGQNEILIWMYEEQVIKGREVIFTNKMISEAFDQNYYCVAKQTYKLWQWNKGFLDRHFVDEIIGGRPAGYRLKPECYEMVRRMWELEKTRKTVIFNEADV